MRKDGLQGLEEGLHEVDSDVDLVKPGQWSVAYSCENLLPADSTESLVEGTELLCATRQAAVRDIQKPKEEKRERLYYIDWARNAIVWGVVVAHVMEAMKECFEGYGEGEYESLLSLEMKLQQIGMPGLFFIAGRIFASSRSSGSLSDFLIVKTRRLLIPLIVGLICFVLPASFIYPKHSECILNYSGGFGFAAIPHWFSCVAGLWWLWFLPALWVFMLLNFFLLKHINQLNDRHFSTVDAGLAFIPPFAVTLVVWIYFKPHWTAPVLYLLPYAFTAFAARPLFQLNANVALLVLRFVFPFSGIILAGVHGLSVNSIIGEGVSDKMAATALAAFHYSLFVASGFVESFSLTQSTDSLLPYPEPDDEKGGAAGDKKLRSRFWWVPLLGFFVPILSTAGPGPMGDILYFWSYPPYRNSFNSFWYVIGTWTYGFWWQLAFGSLLNQKFSEFFYRHATDSAMIIYVCHGLFAAIAGRFVMGPMSNKAPMLVALTTACILTFACSVAFYAAAISLAPCRIVFGMTSRKRVVQDSENTPPHAVVQSHETTEDV